MKELIQAFPQNIIDALSIGSKALITPSKNEIQNITICGMGGSGIGGKIVAQWLANEVNVPVIILNDYTLPAYVNEHSLIIASSYSGNTEETLNAVYKAHEKGARIIGISSGGALVDFCQQHHFDCIQVPGGNPPRTALAFSIVQLITIFIRLGLASTQRLEELKKGHDLIVRESEAIHAEAKKLASYLNGKVGVLYSGPEYEAVATRARQQFNENSKYLMWHHFIPEMNHNELVGWGGGDDRFAPVFIFTDDMDPRNKMRYKITKSQIESKVSSAFEILAKGDSQIERSIYLINLVDWSSWYLADMKKVDAMDISVIDYLKEELSKFN